MLGFLTKKFIETDYPCALHIVGKVGNIIGGVHKAHFYFVVGIVRSYLKKQSTVATDKRYGHRCSAFDGIAVIGL